MQYIYSMQYTYMHTNMNVYMYICNAHIYRVLCNVTYSMQYTYIDKYILHIMHIPMYTYKHIYVYMQHTYIAYYV